MDKVVVFFMATAVAVGLFAYSQDGRVASGVIGFFAALGAIGFGWAVGEEIKIRIDARLRRHYAPKNEAKNSEVW